MSRSRLQRVAGVIYREISNFIVTARQFDGEGSKREIAGHSLVLRERAFQPLGTQADRRSRPQRGTAASAQDSLESKMGGGEARRPSLSGVRRS